MRGGMIYNVPKIRVIQCFIPLSKVNMLNYDYDHYILREF